MKKYYLPVLIIFVLISVGCGKKDDAPPPDSPSVITITEPLAGGIYQNGTILQIRGSISDDNSLSNAKVEIKNKNTGVVYFQQNNPTSNVIFYHLMWNWTISGITGPTLASLKITSTDRYSYQVIKEVDINLDN